jgi:hypothetical protein
MDADLIRQRAYELWQADGCPEGRDVDYWLRAETELAAEDSPAPGEPAGGDSAARSEPDITPLEQAGSPRPARKTAAKAGGRKAASGPATSGGSEPAGSSAAAQAEDRSAYVQQRRTRKKAEG